MKLVLQVIICIVLIMIKQTVSKMVYGLLMKVPCLMLMMVIHHHYEEGEQELLLIYGTVYFKKEEQK